MHTLIFYLLILYFSLSPAGAFLQRNLLSGRYSGSGYNDGVLVSFKADSSFTYRFRGHISSDTAAGKYFMKGDTIILRYDYNNYDSIFASYTSREEEIPLDIRLSAGRATLRPFHLLKRRVRLYYIDQITGNIKTYEQRGKQNKLYLKLYK